MRLTKLDVLQLFTRPVRTVKEFFGDWFVGVRAFIETLVKQQLVTVFSAQRRQVNCLHTQLGDCKFSGNLVLGGNFSKI